MLNIFIAVVSVEYGLKEESVNVRFDDRIDRRLARLLKQHLQRCPRIGYPISNVTECWLGLATPSPIYATMVEFEGVEREEGEETTAEHLEYAKRMDDEFRNMLHPVLWTQPPLANPITVARSSDEMFQELASLSDQMSQLSSLVQEALSVRARGRDRDSELNALMGTVESQLSSEN